MIPFSNLEPKRPVGIPVRSSVEASELDVRSETSRLLHENAVVTFPHIICYHIINFTSLDLWNAAPPDIRSKCREKDSLGDL